ncbi:unnamed protein product [Gulo gulo]|uniref:60S ribosomal protein L29 n=1 Tax=Gulo gulo TaxID=48420 RepID=A0A9X9M7Y3_GULGU|nr:unnamed protein product [Gulo gulo]
MCFAKEHNKQDIKKMQASNTEASSAQAKAVKEPRQAQGGQEQDLERGQPQARSTCLHRSPQTWERSSCPHCQGSQVLSAKVKAQTKAQAATVARAPNGAQPPMKAPGKEGQG